MPVEDFDDNSNSKFFNPPTVPNVDPHERINTATDIRPNPNIPEFQGDNAMGNTNAQTNISSIDNGNRPKVQIKPYKFTFDWIITLAIYF